MGRKIIDIMNERMAKGEPFFSFEYFPPKTEEVRRPVTQRRGAVISVQPPHQSLHPSLGG